MHDALSRIREGCAPGLGRANINLVFAQGNEVVLVQLSTNVDLTVALTASGVGSDGAAMDQLPCNEGRDNAAGRRDARVIAVVDDDEGFRDAIQRFLRTFAFQVEVFASGEEFLRWSRLDAVCCVILDLSMPEMNGLGVQQQLAVRGLQIPIVFVTAHRDDPVWQRASAAGALAVLRKPVDHEELVRLVREALGGQ